MFVRLVGLVLAGSLIVGTHTAAADPILCAQYHDEFTALKAASPTPSIEKIPAKTAHIMGFVTGIYFGDTKRDFVLGDEEEIIAYENAVLELCSKHPEMFVAQAAIKALKVMRTSRSKARPNQTLSATSTFAGLTLETEALDNTPGGFVRVVLLVKNDMQEPANVSVRCSLYDDEGNGVGRAGGWINNVAPGTQAVGEAIGTVEGAVSADCRVVRFNHPS
ncbi:FxLYD domain-containing protein [Afifella sp. H1R]|uniref:FxLYD domain-containing protein n=1 Tax=Afifella sp. H1R TaxID=2908841 RepID=UPI001F161E18|nr:FxLYD domain-containing protein [Afifella sp. H1R]